MVEIHHDQGPDGNSVQYLLIRKGYGHWESLNGQGVALRMNLWQVSLLDHLYAYIHMRLCLPLIMVLPTVVGECQCICHKYYRIDGTY